MRQVLGALLGALTAAGDVLLMSFYIFKKEVKTYFVSPIAYIVTFAFLLVSGYFFWIVLSIYKAAELTNTLRNMGVILLLLLPILTMRLFAEERKQKTVELLFTSPVSFSELVIGKYAACMFLVLVMLGMTGLYPWLLYHYGAPTDWGPVKTGYLGLFLLSATFVAVGLFSSTLTEHPLVAAVIGFAFAIMFWVIGWAAMSAEGWVATVLEALSILKPYDDFVKGIVELKGLVYYASMIFVFLFASIRMLVASRWR